MKTPLNAAIRGTALGLSQWATVVLAVALAFLFGYSLTSLPLLRAGLALSAVVPIALATDTFSITVMEIIDNAVMLLVPGAMDAGLGDLRIINLFCTEGTLGTVTPPLDSARFIRS